MNFFIKKFSEKDTANVIEQQATDKYKFIQNTYLIRDLYVKYRKIFITLK